MDMNIAQCSPCKNTLVLTTKLVHLKYPEYKEGVNITQSPLDLYTEYLDKTPTQAMLI